MIRPVVLALFAAATATSALAQAHIPTPGEIVAKQQADLNRFQATLQANDLAQLQRRNDAALSSPNPDVQVQALVQRQQIHQQIDQNMELQQRMLRPGSNPSDISSQLRQYQAQIQQLQPPPGP
jgi:hypothetical protein